MKNAWKFLWVKITLVLILNINPAKHIPIPKNYPHQSQPCIYESSIGKDVNSESLNILFPPSNPTDLIPIKQYWLKKYRPFNPLRVV